jgi:hypothetical protein
MSESALIGIAFVVSSAGMGLCTLTIEVHWKQLLGARGPSSTQQMALRIAGGVTFALSFWICTKANPVSMAVLVWTMLLTVSAAVVAAALTLAVRKRRPAKT